MVTSSYSPLSVRCLLFQSTSLLPSLHLSPFLNTFLIQSPCGLTIVYFVFSGSASLRLFFSFSLSLSTQSRPITAISPRSPIQIGEPDQLFNPDAESRRAFEKTADQGFAHIEQRGARIRLVLPALMAVHRCRNTNVTPNAAGFPSAATFPHSSLTLLSLLLSSFVFPGSSPLSVHAETLKFSVVSPNLIFLVRPVFSLPGGANSLSPLLLPQAHPCKLPTTNPTTSPRQPNSRSSRMAAPVFRI